MTEFTTLSDKILLTPEDAIISKDMDIIEVKDVKEFIKRLKEEIDKLGIQQTGIHRGYLKMFIDKLAGERLT